MIIRRFFICLVLAGLTLAGFWPVGRLGFTMYDDQEYVVKNPHVQMGFNAESIGWAFTTSDTGNWHPMTWLSHMLDYELFGLNPGGDHWINVGIHAASVVLLFLALSRMTGTIWRSALVAALFAVHPLRVESVAWISERKDVLSAFFMMLTLWWWTRFAQRDAGKKPASSSIQHPASSYRNCNYWLALVFFALGLMSKPMLVTLPIILLLLDFWPLKRISDFKINPLSPTNQRLLIEKLPFFLLVVASCIATVQAQSFGGSVVTLGSMPLDWRIENSLASCVSYLEKIFWPANLAILYPIRHIPVWEVLSSCVLLACLSGVCLWRARWQPWLFIGWCWFLVMLVPVIGLVQVGKEAMADRYTYLPSIGIFIMVAWGMAELAALSKFRRIALTLFAAGLVLACLPAVRQQISYWQSDVKLFNHAIEVTEEHNYEGYLYLGNAWFRSGNLEAAARNYQTSLRIDPAETTHLEQAHYYLGYVRFSQKKFPQAEIELNEALRLNDNDADAYNVLGNTLAAQKKYAEAEAAFGSALQLEPNNNTIRKALAFATLKAESASALTNYYEDLKVKPTAEIHTQIAAILTFQGNYQGAVDHYTAALQLQPDAPDILNNLAWLLVACPDAHIRNGSQAVKYAERACELTHYGVARVVGTLAAAYAEAGRFDAAVSTAQKACDLAEKSGDEDLLKQNEELLKLYRNHQPLHTSATQ